MCFPGQRIGINTNKPLCAFPKQIRDKVLETTEHSSHLYIYILPLLYNLAPGIFTEKYSKNRMFMSWQHTGIHTNCL